MAVLPIVEIPDPRLRLVSKPVEAVDDATRALVADMTDTMYHAKGIGLAAIQVGVPAGVIAHDSRTHEMCTTMGIPVRFDSEIERPLTPERLPELFPFDAEAFLQKRRTLHGSYSQILLDAQIDTVDPLKLMF